MTLFNYALASLGAVCTAKQVVDGKGAALAIDGSDSTELWVAELFGYWVKIDLGAAQYIERVTILQTGGGGEIASSLEVSFSDDGVNYSAFPNFTTVAGQNTISFQGVSHRYWQFIPRGGAWANWKIATIGLVGPIEAPPPPTNPADSYIAAWLDGIEANYVPGVQAWLDAN